MKLVRPADLSAIFQDDGRLLIRSVSLGVGALLPPWVVQILSFCGTPRTKAEIAAQLGPKALRATEQLAEIGILISPELQPTEVMFQNFTAIPTHRKMLADLVRLETYQLAIKEHIKPGDIVIDAGSGTGILALFAAQAGARKVYAIEQSEMGNWIPILAKHNGYEDVIELVRGNFGAVKLPQKADALVTETFGAWALAEGAAAELKKCAEMNLKANATLLPSYIDFYACPLQHRPDSLLSPFGTLANGIDLSPMQAEAYLRSENIAIKGEVSDHCIARLDLLSNKLTGRLPITEHTSALALHFTLDFGANILLPTGPNATLTHWKQTVIACDLSPATYPISASPSSEDKRTVTLQINHSEYRLR